jgi:CO/xanthine dehydrogenase FAD-binding subunit
MDLQHGDAERSVSVDQFFTGYLSTVIEPDELLTSVTFCVPPASSGWCFTEIARRHGDFALVAVAAILDLDPSGRISLARVALGGVGPKPLRVRAAEQFLIGEAPGEDLFRAAAASLGSEMDPADDIHASADYRRHLAGVLVRRALSTAYARHA